MYVVNDVYARIQRRARLAVLLAAGLAAGCGGGGSVGAGGGQDPDPIVLDFPIAYVKRPVPTGMAMQRDARELLEFEPGGDLWVRDRASPSAAERNITAAVTMGQGDVRDVEPSYDGTRLVFALHRPLIDGADDDEQPTWEIWEYVLATDALHRVIQSDTVALQGNDVAPHYLPDGRIVFSSTRQRQSKAVLLDEGKPQFDAQDENRDEPAFVLHVMTAEGGDIHQVSFNQSHDLDPSVLPDGRVVFSRWDGAPGHDEIGLYAMRPDGSGLELLYGANSHNTGTDDTEIHFFDPRPMSNGRQVLAGRPLRRAGAPPARARRPAGAAARLGQGGRAVPADRGRRARRLPRDGRRDFADGRDGADRRRARPGQQRLGPDARRRGLRLAAGGGIRLHQPRAHAAAQHPGARAVAER